MPRSRSPRLALCGAIVALGPLAPGAAAQNTAIRNDSPQRTMTPPSRQDPLYYPFPGEADGQIAVLPEDSPEYLLQQLRDLHSSLRYQQALAVAEQLVALVPDRPLAHYNHACVLSRLRRTDEALAALGRAVETGWREDRHTVYDLDLEPIRQHPGFREIVARMKALRRAERVPSGPLRIEPWGTVVDEMKVTVPQLLERHHVPGAAVALVRGGGVVWSGGFGVQRDPDGAPMTGDARFRLHAPVHLLAMAASLEQQRLNNVDVALVILAAVEPRPSRRLAPAVPVRNVTPSRTTRMRATPADTLALLQIVVENTSGKSFADYCRSEILPEEVESLTFGGGADDLVAGHSRLGTALPSSGGGHGLDMVLASATDLGHIVCGMSGEAVGAELAQLFDELHAAPGLPAAGALALEGERTRYGRRYQVRGERDGVGCLLRWYPESGTGIVVLYNGQGGARAAEQIAHRALGGE